MSIDRVKLVLCAMVCNNFIEAKSEGNEKMVRDLICSMEVDETRAKATYDYEGQTYYFCAPECKDQFIELLSPQINSSKHEREGASIFGDD
jgi:YHS domain-containing protein